MAESWRPLNFSGGKVMGTRRMVEAMCRSPRICQNVRLLRRISTKGLLSGILYLPILSSRLGLWTRVDDSSGTYVFKLRLRKSNILCRAGFTPVANVDQATGESGGKVVRS